MAYSLGNDTFTRANQTGWGLASDGVNTWANVLTGGAPTINISSNTGIITGSTSKIVQELGVGTAADLDVLIEFQVTATTDNVGVVVRDDGTGKNNYFLNQHSGTFSISKIVAGTTTNLFNQSFSISANTNYWIRARIIGSNLYGSIWAASGSEPSTWTVSGTDGTFASAGRHGVRVGLNAVGDTATFLSYQANKAFLCNTETLDKFYTAKHLVTETVEKFYTAKHLVTETVEKFFTKTGLKTETVDRFKTRMGLISETVDRFKTVVGLRTRSVGRFSTRVSLLVKAIDRFYNNFQQRQLKATFLGASKLACVYSPSQALLAIIKAEIMTVAPNSTAIVNATLLNYNNQTQPSATGVSVVVTFPDGSTSSYSLGQGVTNMGAGVYQLIYTTKNPGIHRELWSFTNNDGTVLQQTNIEAVSF